MITPVTMDEYAPTAEVERAIPPETLAYLDNIGNERDKRRWEIGDICVVLIDRDKLPAMQVYQVVGKHVDYGFERVRQLCATSRYYDAATRECYALLHHSIFEYARSCAYPEQVLQSALEAQRDGHSTLALVKNTNKPLMQDIRETYASVRREKRDEANEIMRITLAKLRELQ